MERELRQKAEKLGEACKVIFYGSSNRVEQLLWAMDVFVMPSRFEGLPVTGIEAQASGVLPQRNDMTRFRPTGPSLTS